jgi:hypothetical protein
MNEVILWLIIFVMLNDIRLRKVPFATGIFKEVAIGLLPNLETAQQERSMLLG